MADSERIGRYVIVEEVGAGGMARVYRAFDPNLRRHVALKVMARRMLADETFRLRFAREVRVIATLEHRAIVPVYDFGEAGGRPYLVMRLMGGGSLSERLRTRRLDHGDIQRVLDRIGDALDRAHERGIIHRDLKPDNILYDDDNQPYLSDFGIMKSAGDTSLTATGGFLGTPAYMSPEQVLANGPLDGRSDIYSLGTVLFEMLTGRQPYDSDTGMGMAMAHVTQPVPRLADFLPGFPAGYQAIIDSAMAKEPHDRYASAADLAADFRRLPAITFETTLIERPQPPQKVLDAAIKDEIEVGVAARLLVLIHDRDGRGLTAVLAAETGYGLSVDDVKTSPVFELHFPADESGAWLPAEVEIVVNAPDFHPKQLRRQLEVPPVQPAGALDPEEFQLTPMVAGDLPVTIEVFQQSDGQARRIGRKPMVAHCRDNPSPLVGYKVMSMLFDVHSIGQFVGGQQVNIGRVGGNVGHIGNAAVPIAVAETVGGRQLSTQTGQALDVPPEPPPYDPNAIDSSTGRSPLRYVAPLALLLVVVFAGYLVRSTLLEPSATTVDVTSVVISHPGGSETPTATATAQQEATADVQQTAVAAVVKTMTVAAVLTAEALPALQPTYTPLPTYTPFPTNTAVPSPTAEPSATLTLSPAASLTAAPTATVERDLEPAWQRIGATYDGEAIEVVRFGDGPRRIVLVGGLHAGFAPASELIGANLASHFSQNLHEVPQEVTLYVVPTVNRDSVYAPGEWIGRANGNNVDLNRNWDCNWKENATWRGAAVAGSGGDAPFSEPETRALRDFFLEIQPDLVIIWEARFEDGLISPGKCGSASDTTRESYALAGVFGSAAHYQVDDYEVEASQVINGDANNWLDSMGFPSFAVILDQYEQADWQNNLEGVRAVLDYLGD